MRRSSLMSRKQYLVLIMFTVEKTAWLLCVEPNMVTFLTPVEGRLMQMALLGPHLLGDCCCSIFTVHFFFLHSMFVIVSCHQSLFIQSLPTQSSVFLLFFFLHHCLSSFYCLLKSQLSDLPRGVHRVHCLSGITWGGLSYIQLVCAFVQPLNHYRKDQKNLHQLKQKHSISFEIFTFCFYWKSGSIWDILWVQLRTPVCLLVTSGLCWH